MEEQVRTRATVNTDSLFLKIDWHVGWHPAPLAEHHLQLIKVWSPSNLQPLIVPLKNFDYWKLWLAVWSTRKNNHPWINFLIRWHLAVVHLSMLSDIFIGGNKHSTFSRLHLGSRCQFRLRSVPMAICNNVAFMFPVSKCEHQSEVPCSSSFVTYL